MKQALSILLLVCFISHFPIIGVYASSVRFGIEIEPSNNEPSPTARVLSNGSGGGGGSVGNPPQQNQPSRSEVPTTKNDFPAMGEEVRLRTGEEGIEMLEADEAMELAAPSFFSVDPRNKSSIRTNEGRPVQGGSTVDVSTPDTRMIDQQKNTAGDQTQEILDEQDQTSLVKNRPTPTNIFTEIALAVVKDALERMVDIGLFFQAKAKEVLKFVSWLFS